VIKNGYGAEIHSANLTGERQSCLYLAIREWGGGSHEFPAEKRVEENLY